MAAVEVSYKGSTIGTLSSSGTLTMETEGKYCEADIELTYTAPSGSFQTKTKTYTPSETAQSETVRADVGYDALDEVDVSVGAISSTYVGSSITRRTSSDLSASGATVTAPAGYYENAATKTVASGTEGTPSATKGTVNNHSINVTPSVTNAAGFISGGTHTGTAVSVSASELVSGSETKTANGTYDVTNLAQLIVNVSGGTSDWTLLASHEFTASTTSTTQTVLGYIDLNSLPSGNYIVLVHVRDKAGPRSGYFYGTDSFWMVNNGTRPNNANPPGYTILYSNNAYSMSTSMRGIYPYTINTSFQVQMNVRYSSSTSGTINGTYKCEIYKLTAPTGSPFFG